MASMKSKTVLLSGPGGYSCRFVEKLPKKLQTVCSICSLILREPYKVDCCGISFCKTCLDPFLLTKQCPACSGHFSEVLPDKSLKKTLKQKMVYCTYKSEGCKWTGKLQKFEEHKLSCQYKIRTCEFCREFQGTNEVVTVHKKSCSAATRYLPCPQKCGANVMAKNIEKHVQTRCPLTVCAAVLCTHCKVQVPQKELKEHTKTCSSRLKFCPNGCGEKIHASRIKAHIDKTCSLTPIRCEFAEAGCKEMKSRQDMKMHIEEAKGEHLTLMSTKVKKLQKRIASLTSDSEELCMENEELRAEIDILSIENEELRSENEKMHGYVEKLETEIDILTEIKFRKRFLKSNARGPVR